MVAEAEIIAEPHDGVRHRHEFCTVRAGRRVGVVGVISGGFALCFRGAPWSGVQR